MSSFFWIHFKTVENHFNFEKVYWVYKYCAMLFEKLESFLMSPGFCLLLLESAVSKLWLHYRTFITRILFEFSRGVIGTVATPPVTKAPLPLPPYLLKRIKLNRSSIFSSQIMDHHYSKKGENRQMSAFAAAMSSLLLLLLLMHLCTSCS